MDKPPPHRSALLKSGLVLTGVLLALVCIGVGLMRSPSRLFTEALLTSSIAALLLLLSAGATLVLIQSRNPFVSAALQLGTLMGMLLALIEIINISVEIFVPFDQQTSTVATVTFMGTLFLLFASAGFGGTRRTGQVRFGVLTSIWSAIIGILIAILFGFAMNLLFQQRLEAILVSDMARSGVTDPHAFVWYNTLESASTHLLEGPLLASLLGTIGALVCKGWQRLRSSISGGSPS